MTQFDLPLWRPADPSTSRAAALANLDTIRGNRQVVMKAVIDRPGLTAGELGDATGLGHIEAQRRLSDLKNQGLAHQGHARACTVKGSRMVTWWWWPQ